MKLTNSTTNETIELPTDKICWKTFFLGPILLFYRGQFKDGLKMYFYSALTLGFYWIYYSQKSNAKYAEFLIDKKGYIQVGSENHLSKVA